MPPLFANNLRPLLHYRPHQQFTTSSFHTTSISQASILFQLQGLSNSREGQYLAKSNGLPRQEYSAALQLIKLSEVDPFAKPTKTTKSNRVHLGSASSSNPRHKHRTATTTPKILLSPLDAKALNLGRYMMDTQRRKVRDLESRLGRLLRTRTREKEVERKEHARLKTENRGATVGMVVAVAVATGLASWRFSGGGAGPSSSPTKTGTAGLMDGQTGRDAAVTIAAAASSASGIGAASRVAPVQETFTGQSRTLAPATTVIPAKTSTPASTPTLTPTSSKSSWSWFWSH